MTTQKQTTTQTAAPSAQSAPPSAVAHTPAANRILETADRLFYNRGIGRVGVDTIVAESGVAKATLYAHFHTKDDLVAACLASRSRRQREALEPLLSGEASPRDRVLAAFARRAELLTSPEWRGCAFINARAEYPDPGGVVRDTVDEHRGWIRRFFYELATEAAHPDPTDAASRLIMIWDAAAVSAIFEDPQAIVDGAAVLARGVLNERKQRPTASGPR